MRLLGSKSRKFPVFFLSGGELSMLHPIFKTSPVIYTEIFQRDIATFYPITARGSKGHVRSTLGLEGHSWYFCFR